MEIIWNETSRPRWEALTKTAPWQQHWAYGEAYRALGSAVLRAEIRQGRDTLALVQLVHRRFGGIANAALASRGPVWLAETDAADRAEIYRLIRRSIPVPRPRAVLLTPDMAGTERPVLRRARLTEVMTPYVTACVDLDRDRADLRAAQKGKWRNRLCHAERAGLTTSAARLRPGAADWLLQEEAHQQRARRYAALPPAFVSAWHKATGTEGMVLMTAKRGAERLAAMLFLVHGEGATYHIGWTSDAGRAVSAHNLTLWRGIRALQRKGVKVLDMGGLNTEDTPGIARFKLGAGAEPRVLCGSWV